MERDRLALEARDWERFAAVFAPGFRNIDRRRMLHGELDREAWLASYRPILEMTSSGSTSDVLATRGDRLALARYDWHGTDGLVGPSEIETLELIEVDPEGRAVADITFDPDDLDAAYAELDERYLAGEAAPYARTWEAYKRMGRAVAARDREQLTSVFAPDFVLEDHRRLGFPAMSRDEYVATLRALLDLRPDAAARTHHGLALDDNRVLAVSGWVGDEAEGAFDASAVVVAELGSDGIRRSMHLYELDQLDDAWARYAALRPEPLRIPPNAATRAFDRWVEWLERGDTGDWQALGALAAPTLEYEDRRRLLRIAGDRDMAIASSRETARLRSRPSRTLLATSGDHLALERVLFTSGDDAPAEVDTLHLTEVDAEGRFTAVIVFDPEDRRAASMEMLERYARSDAGARSRAAAFEVVRAVNAHDLEGLRAVLPDDFVLHDHRRTGLGRLGAEDYLASAAALFEEAPDVTVETLHVIAVDEHGALSLGRTFGTLREGGEFESVYLRIVLHRGDRLVAIEMFEPEDLAVARARFEELRPDPTRIPPNEAWRARERASDLIRAGDWEGLRALATADFTYEDRQKHALVTGDVEVLIKSAQEVTSWPGWRSAHALMGTAGDRIMVERWAGAGEPDTGAFEIEQILLVEVAADGRLVAWIKFDVEDRSAAFAEAQDRFAAREAAAVDGQAPVVALRCAYARHDWEAIRGCLARDAVVCDRRALGVLGVLDRDQWVESLRTLAELAPDVGGETIRIVTWNHRGRVDVFRQFGTTLDGGPFEHLLVRVFVTDGPHVTRCELFEVGDEDRALARFAELCRVDGGPP
jgi:SnoaL-like domain